MDTTWNKHKLGLTCKKEDTVKNTLIAAHEPVKCTLFKTSGMDWEILQS